MEPQNVYDWPEFEEEIHFGANQLKRIDSAIRLVKKVKNLNSVQRSCEIQGTAETPYYVTAEACGCVDFSRNHKEVPCKHMYALMIALGKFGPAPYLEEYKIQQKYLNEPFEIDAFADWPSSCDDHASGNFRRATVRSEIRYDILELDREKQTAVFTSTIKGGFFDHAYETTLHECGCADFYENRKPCKHIYRLAVELGLLDKNGKKPE